MVALSTDLISKRRRKTGQRLCGTAAGLMRFWRNMNIMIKKRKKNKKKMNTSQAEIISRNNMMKDKRKRMKVALDDDFVVCEILSRLPVKTLMRFISVCIRWRSSIQHDPHFHQLQYDNYSEKHPLRLFTITTELGSAGSNVTGYQVSDAADNFTKGVEYHTFQEWDTWFSVHGLICVLNWQRDAARIYNPSTRQETQWINITRSVGNQRIVFGFDPVTKKHKVLCRRTKTAASEVLTVGENAWRRIDHDEQVPSDNLLFGPCVYQNGAIYWMEKIPSKKGRTESWNNNGAPEVLVAFDFGSEKFRVIPIPDFIIQQPRYISYSWYERIDPPPFTNYHLLEVNGSVALLGRKNKSTVSMWTFEHEGNWNEVIIALPLDLVWKDNVWNDMTVRFNNVPVTDQIIVEPYFRGGFGPAYSLNWKKNTSEKLSPVTAVRPYYERPPRDRCRTEYERRTYLRESLFPVN